MEVFVSRGMIRCGYGVLDLVVRKIDSRFAQVYRLSRLSIDFSVSQLSREHIKADSYRRNSNQIARLNTSISAYDWRDPAVNDGGVV